MAGAGFALFLLCFYLLAGRNVINTPKWLAQESQFLIKSGLHKNWIAVLFFKSLVASVFSCCLSAALFAATAFGNTETSIFYFVLSGTFLIIYTFDVTNLDIKLPRTFLVTSIVIEIAAIISFFSNFENGMLLTVFLTYMGIFMFINLVLDTLTRHGATTDRISYSGIYSIFMILCLSFIYGNLLYGNISTKLGGARPQSVQLSLKKEANEILPPSAFAKNEHTLNGYLIHQTDHFLYIDVLGKTMRLRSDDIIAMVVTPEKERNGLIELAAKITANSASSHSN